MTKLIMVPALILLTAAGTIAQNVAINTDGSLANTNAILDIKSSNKGLLIPRMTTVERTAIPNTQGLLVYDISNNAFWYNDGASWKELAAGAAWFMEGNTGTDHQQHFMGTTDNVPLSFRVNNLLSGQVNHLTNNTFWGYRTGIATVAAGLLTPGSRNTAMGTEALSGNVSGTNNTAIGRRALFANTSNNNTATGASAMLSNTTGNNNTANGYLALYTNTSGSSNTAMGADALRLNVTGNSNTAVGTSAGYSNETGNFNTAVGLQSAMSNKGGNFNTAGGTQAMFSNISSSHNTAYGFQAMYNIAGERNTAVGSGAAFGPAVPAPPAGFSSTTAIGYRTVVAANAATAIGHEAIASGLNSTAIGNGAIATASNTIRLGNNSITVVESTGSFATVSDGRFKSDIMEDVKGLAFIMRLRPVTYLFNTNVSTTGTIAAGNGSVHASHVMEDDAMQTQLAASRRTGFIAQEVEAAAESSQFMFSGINKPVSPTGYYSLSYDSFVVPLVKAVQEQQAMIAALQAAIGTCKEREAAVSRQLAAQEQKMLQLEKELNELKRLGRK